MADATPEEQPQSFVSWHAAAAGLKERRGADADDASGPAPEDPPFAIAPHHNRRLVLTRAPQPWSLEVDALVIGNNEALSDRIGVQGEVFARGGAGLSAQPQAQLAALCATRRGEHIASSEYADCTVGRDVAVAVRRSLES